MSASGPAPSTGLRHLGTVGLGSLLLWVAVVSVGLWWGRSTPEPPSVPEEAKAVEARKAKWIERDVEAWRREFGDHRIRWDQAHGHLAIVIDDVGRELEAHAALQSLRYPLTFSILPGSVYAAGAQLRLREDPRRYREIWLHMPMEPLDKEQMTRGDEARERFLQVGDSEAQLRAKLEAAVKQVPAAVGLNNHMGSRLTADPTAMDVVAQFVVEHELLFLDSRTTAETVAADAVRLAGGRVAERQVFLDHEPDPAKMARALEEAVERAKTEPVVAIGHPSPALAEVLEVGLERARQQNVGIYPLSELISRSARGTRSARASGRPADIAAP